MTVQEQIAPARSGRDSVQSRRARYHCPENGFSFAWPAVPAHQFLAERDRAMDPGTPTSTIELDIAKALGLAYPATTPTMLTRYIKLRAGDALRCAWAASASAVARAATSVKRLRMVVGAATSSRAREG